MNAVRKPCSECPFRRESAPGWLGPWEPNDLLNSLRVQVFPCHKTIPEDDVAADDQRLKGCAGAAIYLNNKIERSRCPEQASIQDQLKGVDQSIKDGVFKTSAEFIEHHTWRRPKG